MATRKNALFLAAIAAPLAMAASSASAVLVDEWGYTVDSGFDAFGPASVAPFAVEGSDPNPAFSNRPTVLSWGDPVNVDPSSISITPTVVPGPNLETNGAAVPGATFTHNNFVINDPNNNSLDSFTIATRVVLTPLAPPEVVGDPDEVLQPNPILFPSLFFETPNAQDPCPAGETDDLCNDIFVLTSPSALSTNFVRDGFLYTVDLNVLDLDPLSESVCGLFTLDAGCLGFETAEDAENTFRTEFSISAVAVPEPGILGLVGLGLFGIGAASRRRSRGR